MYPYKVFAQYYNMLRQELTVGIPDHALHGSAVGPFVAHGHGFLVVEATTYNIDIMKR